MEPIVHELRLTGVPPADAFAAYTERIGTWWHPAYTADADTFADVVIEPRTGGAVTERHTDGRAHEWGRVTAYEPGRRLAHTFALAQDPAHPSLVTVEFTADTDGTRVRFEHGGWTAANVADRAKFGDWPMLLARYETVARSAGPSPDGGGAME